MSSGGLCLDASENALPIDYLAFSVATLSPLVCSCLRVWETIITRVAARTPRRVTLDGPQRSFAAGEANPCEWWHHRLVISRNSHLLCAAPFTLATFLVACGTAPGNYRNDAAHEALLQALRQCLVELSISGERDKDFRSPCVGRDVSSLNGIGRDRLIDALGPARLCITPTEVNFPEKENCPLDQDPLWSFYRHAGSIDMGGGPELVCVANKQTHCMSVEWRRTK